MRVERPGPAKGQAVEITELWAWTAYDPMTNVEGIMAWKMPDGGAIPLVTSMRDMADRMEPAVREVVATALDPKPVPRLRRFVPADGT